ncbi:N-acetyltransferase family protein [Propionibacteriaceae bacterium G57]|uniref:GNAT family N-acetyltransferase n=1 Tax=Aestuariimicrobium sp. G57 TaxID=3418485 RepID=UPI003DA6F566
MATRNALPTDADALATIMAVRGGTAHEHLVSARRLIARLEVLLIAEQDGAPVGWCGIQKVRIRPGAELEWLVAGLTVVPAARRRGIGARLLGELVRDTPRTTQDEPIFSVINAGNLASIDLHLELGFLEVERAATFAGIKFSGGVGVLLSHP